jgi:hypothetical protein
MQNNKKLFTRTVREREHTVVKSWRSLTRLCEGETFKMPITAFSRTLHPNAGTSLLRYTASIELLSRSGFQVRPFLPPFAPQGNPSDRPNQPSKGTPYATLSMYMTTFLIIAPDSSPMRISLAVIPHFSASIRCRPHPSTRSSSALPFASDRSAVSWTPWSHSCLWWPCPRLFSNNFPCLGH